jgi:hypothetical protein
VGPNLGQAAFPRCDALPYAAGNRRARGHANADEGEATGLIHARVNCALPTREKIFTLIAGGALHKLFAYGTSTPPAEACALRGLDARTIVILAAGKRGKVSIADKAAIAVSLCQYPLWWAVAALAHPVLALHSRFAAVEALATVILVSIKVYAPAVAAGLVRTAPVAAAATMALVGLKVYAPLSAAGLPLGASVVVGSSLTDAEGSQRAPYEGCAHQPKRLTSREGAAGQGSR